MRLGAIAPQAGLLALLTDHLKGALIPRIYGNDPIHNLQHRLVLSRLTAFGPFQCTTLQTQGHILEEHEVLEDLVEKS